MKNTIGFQTRTDDINIQLAETTDRVVRFTVRDDHVIDSSAGVYIENRIQWAEKFRTMTGLREDLYYGSDQSTPLQANSGTIVQGITSPKGNLIFGPWQDTEYYLSVGQGFHSNDLRGALTNLDALATEINFMQGNPTVPQGKTPLLTKATGYEVGVRSTVPKLKLEGALFVLDLASEATFDGDEAVTRPAGRASARVLS